MTRLGLYFVQYSRFGYCRVLGTLLNARYRMAIAMRALLALMPVMALILGRLVTPMDGNWDV